MGYTKAFTLDKGGKSSWFDCHRRFLPANHPYRRNKTNFKKDVREKDLPPPRLPPGVIWNQLLPIAFGSLPKHVLDPLTEISQFFRDICASALKVEDIIKLDQNIALILCKLEQVFPPGFFDSMEHLPVHLAYEAYLGGPVQYRWMYPFESTAEHVRRMTKEMGRPPLMIELITRTRTKKSGGFVDDRTQKAFDDYQTLLANFLEHNPQYRPAEGEPLNGDVDFYIWNECEIIVDSLSPSHQSSMFLSFDNSFPTPAKQDCPFLTSPSYPSTSSSISSLQKECKQEIVHPPPSSSANDYYLSGLTFDDSEKDVTLSSTLDSHQLGVHIPDILYDDVLNWPLS
ncbi:unnamed protein product [Vicia faba]|uniref:DUF4218 domain-containing protein n=1 Tax=Vicia faba TaxID=3906 RepID=A0AAV1AQY2_VICFA|nr:unnamed protein product [Vicia faba]